MIVLFRIVFFFSMGALSLSMYEATKMAKDATAKIAIRDLRVQYVGFTALPSEQQSTSRRP